MKSIAAISTALGAGGISIIRISGDDAVSVADKVFISISGKKIADMNGYQAALGYAVDVDGNKIDDVLALNFSGPKSYTGENVVELSCHGGIYVTRKLLGAVITAGAAPAGAGEFTKRAFLNGKLDLTQAEAVAGLLSANGEQALKAAVAGGDGVLTKRIEKIKREIISIASHLSAWADFPEEDVPEVDEQTLIGDLQKEEARLLQLLNDFGKGKIMREGIPTVIAGRANAGKSTLMNLLSGEERSIVTEFEGTTRDIVEESISLGDVILNIADTAGLRDTVDPVERIGVEAAKKRIEASQLILAVFDSSRKLDKDDFEFINSLNKKRTIAIINKTDLESQIDINAIENEFQHIVYISAINSTDTKDLLNAVKVITDTKDFDPSSGILFTERQKSEVKSALLSITEAREVLQAGMTLDAVTICVESALNSLYNLTGEKASENIIDEVFSEFCVGK